MKLSEANPQTTLKCLHPFHLIRIEEEAVTINQGTCMCIVEPHLDAYDLQTTHASVLILDGEHLDTYGYAPLHIDVQQVSVESA